MAYSTNDPIYPIETTPENPPVVPDKHTLADPSHPMWKLLRLIVVATVILIFFLTMYKSPLEMKDILLILTTLIGLGGFDQAKAMVTR